MDFNKKFDCIVVGGGHAGTEAALASARMGAQTLLITHNIETIGQMSCNPAIGGIGKGHLVKEIDAMGGIMAHAADKAGIQFKILNSSKGPAVRATRVQACRTLYRQAIRMRVESQENLTIFQQPVHDLLIKNNKVIGVTTQMGLSFFAHSVVLTVGTFLAGTIHIGESNFSGGRAGDPASVGLAEFLRSNAFRIARLKTGTPPRIDGKSINFSILEEEPGDTPVPVFSFLGKPSDHPKQVSCFITHTNEKTHDLIRSGLDRSPMYSGRIEGIGPRYCPSIEDKIVRFSDKESHQIFIEPEGLFTQEFYPNGISTSLPFDVQLAFVRSIVGFENAHITRPGYAIEYDFFDPRDLHPSLESKIIENLFFAGQINGTTGYEEAAAQGLIAGMNAALKANNKPTWYPKRHEAYIGVLIDDLVTHGTIEPYRMFTSRAEHRLILREDNADLRLTPKAQELGLLSKNQWEIFSQKADVLNNIMQRLSKTWISVQDGRVSQLRTQGFSFSKEATIETLLKRPEMHYALLESIFDKEMRIDFSHSDPEHVAELINQIKHQIETSAKYAGYIEKQKLEIEKTARLENTLIPANFNFRLISGLSAEVIEKLESSKPATVGLASRIPGITPAAISLLLVYLKKHTKLEKVRDDD